MKKPKIFYFTSWYSEKNKERKAELMKCIGRTLSGGEVDHVCLLDESNDEFEQSKTFFAKLTSIKINRRPTYNDFFTVANRIANEGDIVIIANTDLYPEKGNRLYLESMQQNECFALSRYDEDEDGKKIFFNRWDSQDAWIFKAPIKPIEADFLLGTAGCDCAISQRAHKAGYRVFNPSKTIKFNHLHNSGIRTYDPDVKVPKPYLLITPHDLGEMYNHHFIY
jgi:hypothetical protein